MTSACTQNTDRECREDDCCLVNHKLEALKIPTEISHDHSQESFDSMSYGVNTINMFLNGLHEDCVAHMVKYAELNIRAFFLFHLADKQALEVAIKLFFKNINKVFLKQGAHPT